MILLQLFRDVIALGKIFEPLFFRTLLFSLDLPVNKECKKPSQNDDRAQYDELRFFSGYDGTQDFASKLEFE